MMHVSSLWRSEDIIAATGGKAKGRAFAATHLAIDSRRLRPGALFVALKGERVDGHDYVKEALVAGAAGALVQRVPEGLPEDAPLVCVRDAQKALADIAVAARARAQAKMIAVTGSVGKTSTKDAILAALGAFAAAYGTAGNLNNHIGLPLSLANMPLDARFGVFELGMNHAGELAFLSRILRPDIAVITNVEAVHLEFFDHVEAIADAKAEIMEGMPKSGTIILNRDSPYFDRLLKKAKTRGLAHIVTFGAHAQAQCRLVNYTLQDLGSHIEAIIHGTPVSYRLSAVGRHWAMTSLAALAACIAAGADLADAAAALTHFREPDGRGKLHRLTVEGGFATLIDDCYNASPASVAAAIAKLADLKAALGGKGRAIAALGDMLELGASASELHKGLLIPLTQSHIDKVYLAGPLMHQLHAALAPEMHAGYAASAAELAPMLAADLRAGDVVLVKGSRGSRMDIVRDALFAIASSSTSKESAHAL